MTYNHPPKVRYEYFSDIQGGVFSIASGAGVDKTLPSIVVPSNPGAIIEAAYLDVVYTFLRNDNAANNAISGSQYIQIDKGAGFNNAILLPTQIYYCEALGTTQNPKVSGNIDLSALFTWGDTLTIKWAASVSVRNSLYFYGPQLCLRIRGRVP